MQKTINKEGLKEIFTQLPFVPIVPIGRKKFFVGLLIIGPSLLIISIGLGIAFGIAAMFLPEMVATFVQMLVTIIVISYITATWYTKRLIDIHPQINVKKAQITLVTLVATVNILGVITGILISKFTGHYSETGEILKLSNIEFITIIFSIILGIAGTILFLFLCFKKGGTKTAEFNFETARDAKSERSNIGPTVIDWVKTTMKKTKELWLQNSTPASLLFALFCLVLIFLFYWFQLRPVQIRKECYEEVVGMSYQKTSNDPAKRALGFKAYEKYYQPCLIKNGISK